MNTRQSCAIGLTLLSLGAAQAATISVDFGGVLSASNQSITGQASGLYNNSYSQNYLVDEGWFDFDDESFGAGGGDFDLLVEINDVENLIAKTPSLSLEFMLQQQTASTNPNDWATLTSGWVPSVSETLTISLLDTDVAAQGRERLHFSLRGVVTLADGEFWGLWGPQQGAYTATISLVEPGGSGTTALLHTPVPAALPLFGSALGVAGAVGWRRRRRITVVKPDGQ